MIRPFLPPPEMARCCAVTWETYYAARCPYLRVKGSDLCQKHWDLMLQGRKVRRVKRPELHG